MTFPSSDDSANPDLRNALAIEELVRANADSNQTMLALVKGLREETKARDRKVEALDESVRQQKKLMVVAVIAVVILLMIAGVNAYNIAGQRATSHQVRDTNALLLDCLNREGRCGQFNAQQQALLLDEVKKYELTGFYCIRTNPADRDPAGEAFLKCMNRLYPGGPQLEKP